MQAHEWSHVSVQNGVYVDLPLAADLAALAAARPSSGTRVLDSRTHLQRHKSGVATPDECFSPNQLYDNRCPHTDMASSSQAAILHYDSDLPPRPISGGHLSSATVSRSYDMTVRSHADAPPVSLRPSNMQHLTGTHSPQPTRCRTRSSIPDPARASAPAPLSASLRPGARSLAGQSRSRTSAAKNPFASPTIERAAGSPSRVSTAYSPAQPRAGSRLRSRTSLGGPSTTTASTASPATTGGKPRTSTSPPPPRHTRVNLLEFLKLQQQEQQQPALNTEHEQHPQQLQSGLGRHTGKGPTAAALGVSGGSHAADMMTSSSRGGPGCTRTPSPSSRARSPGTCNGGTTMPATSCSVSGGSGASAPPINLGDLPAGALRRVDVQLRRADSGLAAAMSVVAAAAMLPAGPLSAPECVLSRSPPHVTSWLLESQEGDGGGEEKAMDGEGQEPDAGPVGAWEPGGLGQGHYMTIGAAEPGSRPMSPVGQQTPWGRGHGRSHAIEYPPTVCEAAARIAQSPTWVTPIYAPLRTEMAAEAQPPVAGELNTMSLGTVRYTGVHALPVCHFDQPASGPVSGFRRSTTTDLLVGTCGWPPGHSGVVQSEHAVRSLHGAPLTSEAIVVNSPGVHAQRRPESPPSASSTATQPDGAVAAIPGTTSTAAAPSVVFGRSVPDRVSGSRTVAICDAVPQQQAAYAPTLQHGTQKTEAPRTGAQPTVAASSPRGKSHGTSCEGGGTGRETGAAPSSPAAAVTLRHLPSWAPLYGSKAASPVKETLPLSASRGRSSEGHTDRGGYLQVGVVPALLVPRSSPRDWSVEDGDCFPDGDGGSGDPSCSSKSTFCTGRRVVGHAWAAAIVGGGGEEAQGPAAATSHSFEISQPKLRWSYPPERPLGGAVEGTPFRSSELEEGRKEEQQPVTVTPSQVVAAAVAVDGPRGVGGGPRDQGLSLQRELYSLRRRLEVLEGEAAATCQVPVTSGTTAVPSCVCARCQAPAGSPPQVCVRVANGGDKGKVRQSVSPSPQQQQHPTAIVAAVTGRLLGGSSGAVQGTLRETPSGSQHPVALLAVLATEAAHAAEVRAEAQQQKLEDLEAQLAATRTAAEVAEARAEARLAALSAQVVALQGELRRQQEASREALDQLAKGTEHVAACMLSAFMPVAGASGGGGSGGSGGGEGGGGGSLAPAASEGSSQRPSPLQTQTPDGEVTQETSPPQYQHPPPLPTTTTMTPRTMMMDSATTHQGSALTTSRSGEHCVLLFNASGDGDVCVPSVTASTTHRITRPASTRLRSRCRAATSSVECSSSSAVWRSSGNVGGGGGVAGRTVMSGGGGSAAASADVRRQLRALQQEMRRLRALMAAQVVVAAAGTASGGAGGVLGRLGQGCGGGVSQRLPLQHRSCQLRGQRGRGTAGLEGPAVAVCSKEEQQEQRPHQQPEGGDGDGRDGGGGSSSSSCTVAASQQQQDHQPPLPPQVPGPHDVAATAEGHQQGEGRGDVGAVSRQQQELGQGPAGLWQKVLRLGSDVGELRWGEAVMVETQDTLIELVADLRRDLEELRGRGSTGPSRTASPTAGHLTQGDDQEARCGTPRHQQEASIQQLPVSPIGAPTADSLSSSSAAAIAKSAAPAPAAFGS